jgi:hypothetical protein
MLPEFLLASRLTFLISSCCKKKEPKCACLSEARASHSQRIWAEVSSSTPHLLHNGLFDSVLLKDKNLALVPRQGPEISSRACLRVSPRTHHHPQCWLVKQRLILLISCLETPKAGSGPTNLEAGPPLSSPSVISLPLTPACPGTHYSPTACRVQEPVNEKGLLHIKDVTILVSSIAVV